MDFICRGMISSGELQQLIEHEGVSGVTSNPLIFEKALTESHDYDDAIRSLTRKEMTSDEIYQARTVENLQNVADLLRPTYERTNGQDIFIVHFSVPELKIFFQFGHSGQPLLLTSRAIYTLPGNVVRRLRGQHSYHLLIMVLLTLSIPKCIVDIESSRNTQSKMEKRE